MNYFIFITILAVIGVNEIRCQQSDDDVDGIIGQIFNLTDNSGNNGNVVEQPKNLICVPYDQCDSETNKVYTNGDGINGSTDGAFIIDIRFGEPKCEHYLEVLCEAPDGYQVSTTTLTPPVTQRPVPTVPPPRCGTRNIKGVGLEVTGTTDEAQFGEFPWMTAVLKKEWVPNTKDSLAQCGGSIIHPQVILTGAHCVHGHTANELKVRAGEWDTQTTLEALPYQEVDVDRIISHEKFNQNTLVNDMALLILKSPLKLDRHISTVCLPKQNQQFTQDNCIATGWGKDVFGIEGQYQVILKRIELPMVAHESCQRALRTTRLGNIFRLDPSFVCAGGVAGKDTCLGDGGSPLVCPSKNGQYEQAGIVAWGIGCGEDGIPGVYGNVAAFRSWVDNHMTRLGYGTSSYEN